MQLSRSNGRPNSFHCSILYYSLLSHSDLSHMWLFTCDPPQNILHFYLLFEMQSQIITEWNSLGLITLMSSSLHKVLQGGLPHNVDTLWEHLQEGDFTQRCAGHALFLHIQPRLLDFPAFSAALLVNHCSTTPTVDAENSLTVVWSLWSKLYTFSSKPISTLSFSRASNSASSGSTPAARMCSSTSNALSANFILQ